MFIFTVLSRNNARSENGQRTIRVFYDRSSPGSARVSQNSVLFEFNTADYFFIKNIATLQAFHNSCSHMWHYTHMMCFANKYCDIQSYGFLKVNINFELRVRRTYDLLPLLSWPTTCFGIDFELAYKNLERFGL